jgi:hypothetical protein
MPVVVSRFAPQDVPESEREITEDVDRWAEYKKDQASKVKYVEQ